MDNNKSKQHTGINNKKNQYTTKIQDSQNHKSWLVMNKIDKFDNWLVIYRINIPTKLDKMDIIGKKDGINRNG
jgi:hypothetical protein